MEAENYPPPGTLKLKLIPRQNCHKSLAPAAKLRRWRHNG
jgi:hypothetical protein